MNLKNDEKDRRLIEEQAEKILLLTDLIKAGSWVISFAPDGSLASVQWGDGFRRLMGYSDQNDFPNEMEPFLQGIYPEDRDVLIGELTASVFNENVIRTKDFDFRFCRKNGSVRWYRTKGILSRDSKGRPIEFSGVTIDITQEREHDALYVELQNEAASLNTIHEMLGSGKWTMDFDEAGEMVRVNWSDEFRRMLGYHDKNDFPDVLESWNNLLHPDDRDRVLKEFNETISDYSGQKTYDVEYRLMTKNRGYRWYRAVGKPTRRPDGSPITYVGVFIDITEQKAMIEELAQQRESLSNALEEANQANKAKTAFLSNMSHEIRTPMNAIIGLNRIALNEPGISETTREYLEKMGLSARHLLGIINDILDMTRIESGRMNIKNEEFSFAKVLEQVNTIISGQCREKGLEYECRVKGAVDEYYIGDDMKLRQVMINILGNAIKFTPSGGSITFLVESIARFNGRSTLQFTISDTGIGMSKEFLPKLFDAFSQEDSSGTSRFGSTGLGMAITKSIIELMNGTITVESVKQKGTTFTVTVTLIDCDRRESVLQPDEKSGTESEESVLQPDEQNMRKSEETVLHPPKKSGTESEGPWETIKKEDTKLIREKADLKGRRVLLAEDVKVNAEIMIMLLTMREMEVEHAENGRIAIEKFEGHEEGYYDAILMDIRMPEIDGLEATRKIRAMKRSDAKNIPIIALTANAFDEDVQRSMQAGLNAHLSKPVEPDILFETLEGLLPQ
ncbi:MAG: PAS domain-containing protein [Parasporobacterium sp.]|nr:PAS domain-containing protein [Parasporobacterium sp.]